jgi:hypothetical protein
MKQNWLLPLLFIFVVAVTDLHAATYRWTDTQGTVHFTENREEVPQPFRATAGEEDEREAVPAEQDDLAAPVAEARETPAAPVQQDGQEESSPTEVYAGKTLAQWEQELREREAAMTALRSRIDEVVVLLKRNPPVWDEQDKLIAEHRSLLAKFAELRAQYDQQVEIARKGGAKITIQQ